MPMHPQDLFWTFADTSHTGTWLYSLSVSTVKGVQSSRPVPEILAAHYVPCTIRAVT
jgi:hypothetical protein